MYRDRTNLYVAYRRTFPHHNSSISRFDSLPDEEEGLVGLTSKGETNRNGETYFDDEPIELETLPPSLVQLQNASNEILESLDSKIQSLNKLYKKNLLPGFSDTTNIDSEIDKLSNSITIELTNVYKQIKELDRLKLQFKTKSETKMVDNLKKQLALRVQELSGGFRKMQGNYIKYLKHDDDNKTGTTGFGIGGEDDNDIERYSKDAMRESSKQIGSQQQQQQQQQQLDENFLQQREREIYKIAQGVVEISIIFKELENIVIDQGTVLDRIDYNLSKTVENVQNAEKQMTKAEGYQKATAKCKIVLFLVLLILLFLMILMVKPRRVDHYVHDSSSAPIQPTPDVDTDTTSKPDSTNEISDDHTNPIDAAKIRDSPSMLTPVASLRGKDLNLL